MKRLFILSVLATATLCLPTCSFAQTKQHSRQSITVEPLEQRHKLAPSQSLVMPYQTTTDGRLPRVVHQARRAGTALKADFSVQDAAAQEAVWTENFDSEERDAKGNLKLDGWVLDKGADDVITFTKEKTTDYAAIDPSDVYSLHIDGPYQVYKRTKASATTASAIAVPRSGLLHAYVRMSPIWNEYVTLSLQVSSDDFDTSVELWNSKQVTSGQTQWVKIDADLKAFVGKAIKIRLFWGPGTNDTFNTGGYMGDFYVDGLSVTGVKSVDNVKAFVGETIRFADFSDGDPVKWAWTFTGAQPESSAEQNPEVVYTAPGNFDVTLTVTDATGNTNTVTKQAFASIEGVAPVAGVIFPADFRDLSTRMRMVAPLAEVEYKDASTGYPTGHNWMLYTPADMAASTSPLFQPDTIYTTPDVRLRHEQQGKWWVTHVVDNATGYDFVDDSVQVTLGGMATNFMPQDGYQTNFTDGDLTLPGANKMGITAWAEKISKPSTPVVLEAMYVNFTKARAEALTDQIASVSFTLYTSENGLPGKPIALLDSWMMSELNYAMTTNNGIVTLELSQPYVIDDEVFLVIDGIPEKNDTLECAIAMAPMRSTGNTAYMLNKGTWRPFTGYFQAAPGGQTSLAVFPYFSHSVIVPAKVDEQKRVSVGADSVVVGGKAGQTEAYVFAYLGVKSYVGSSENWVSIEGKPGEYTVDTLNIKYDALPDGIDRREATLTVTDGIQSLDLKVVQLRDSGQEVAIGDALKDERDAATELFDLQGRRATTSSRGLMLIRKADGTVRKRVLK